MRYERQLTFGTGPVVRVGPGEVDVTDLPAVKTIHTVKATYIKSPKFYRSLTAPGVESVFSTTDVRTLNTVCETSSASMTILICK